MPNLTSNVVLYATLAARYPVVNIPTATVSTTTLLITAASTGTILTDILWRTADATVRTWDVIICATGSQATAENARVMVSIPANSGNNGGAAIASLAALVPTLFDIDLAGNRVLTLEAGQSVYVRNSATTAGFNYITVKARDY